MDLHFNARGRLAGVALLMAIGAAACGGSDGGTGGWSGRFGSAAVVLGQTGFDQLVPQEATTPIVTPVGSAAVSADGRLFVPSNRLLLVFDEFESINGPRAAQALDLSSISAGEGLPSSVSASGSRLVAAVSHRVHIYNTAPLNQAQALVPAISVGPATELGCSASTLRQPRSAILTPLGQLVVADTFNHRVLIWNTVPASGSIGAPDLVLGQRSFDTCAENDDQGDGINDDNPTARTLRFPASVWSDGIRLLVSDGGNHRVLIWNSFPTAGDPASHEPDHVLGQESFSTRDSNAQGMPSATTLRSPSSLDVSAAGELAVTDVANHRILIWRSMPTRNAQPADHVVGQSDFAHGHANDADQSGRSGEVPSARTLSQPHGVRFHGRNLIVTDTGNNRVLVWRERD